MLWSNACRNMSYILYSRKQCSTMSVGCMASFKIKFHMKWIFLRSFHYLISIPAVLLVNPFHFNFRNFQTLISNLCKIIIQHICMSFFRRRKMKWKILPATISDIELLNTQSATQKCRTAPQWYQVSVSDLPLDTIHKYYILTNVLTKYLDNTIFFSTLQITHYCI